MLGTQGVRLVGVGGALPAGRLTNDHLAQLVDTNDEWIRTRTGMRQRALAGPEVTLTQLAADAVRNALEAADLEPSQIDLLVLATSTPDDLFGTASLVLAELGAPQAVGFDLTAACSGFVFGLVTAGQFLATGAYRTAVVVGADMLSRWVDWTDRGTCILFGDGAGAMVLQAGKPGGLLGFALHNDGSQNSCLTLRFQPSPRQLVDDLVVGPGQFHPITMHGQKVYQFAVRQVPEIIEKALFRAGCTQDQVDWLVLHQANQRILDAVAERLGIPPERVVSTVAEHGNTSAASIPLALEHLAAAGRLQPGQVLALAGFGAGLTLGAAICRWG